MRVFTLSLVFVTASASVYACTSHVGEPVAEQAPTLTPKPTPMPTSTSTPSPPSAGAPAWRWIHFAAPSQPFPDIGPLEVFAGDHACSVVARGEHEAKQVCCTQAQRRWCVSLGEDFVPGVSLACSDDTLFVADYGAIASGARIAAHRLVDGTLLWTREALAIGPQEHSEYFNVVQLRLIEGRLIAYGDESHGAYVEVMDPSSGALLDHARVEPPKVEWQWDASAPEPEPQIELALPEGGRCRFVGESASDRATLECSGAHPWSRELDADFVGRGALALADGLVVLVTWSRIANGARAHAFERETGELVWAREIEGIGPQDHSKYSNLVQIVVNEGLVIVHGDEAHGRYSEALALDSGALRWSIRWPP